MQKLQTIFSIFLIFMLTSIAFPQESWAQDTPKDQIEAVSQDDSSTTNIETPKKEKSTDWFSLIIASAYLIGVFIMLPLVIYTNLNEKIFDKSEEGKEVELIDGLSEAERNERAATILEDIEVKMDKFTDDEGVEMVTVGSGQQARRTKRGLDYITKHLDPTDADIIARTEEFTQVYVDRNKRVFTGSKWIIGCAIGLIVFMGIVDLSMLFSSFIVLHLLGLLFYYLSSRTPIYALEKRMKYFGSGKLGIIGSIMGGLFVGMAAKEYVSINGGPWQRDYEGELTSSLFLILIAFIAAMFIAFMIALFGVINFVINYSTSFLNPLDNEIKWYKKTYES